MLTPADIKRPSVRRVAHTVTALTSPIWALIALIAYSVGLINVVTLWSFETTLHWLNRLKWWAAEAYVKRWPTPLQPGYPLYAFSQSREMPTTPCKVVKFRRYSLGVDTLSVAVPKSIPEDDMIMTPVFRCHRHGGYGFVSDCEVCSTEISAESARMQDPARNKFHPTNWSAPMPISEARKADPLVEEAMQKLARGEISLS